jgi:hypothetical protein
MYEIRNSIERQIPFEILSSDKKELFSFLFKDIHVQYTVIHVCYSEANI